MLSSPIAAQSLAKKDNWYNDTFMWHYSLMNWLYFLDCTCVSKYLFPLAMSIIQQIQLWVCFVVKLVVVKIMLLMHMGINITIKLFLCYLRDYTNKSNGYLHRFHSYQLVVQSNSSHWPRRLVPRKQIAIMWLSPWSMCHAFIIARVFEIYAFMLLATFLKIYGKIIQCRNDSESIHQARK